MKKKVYGRISFSISIEGPATIIKEENWYVSTFIPLDVSSQGKTIREAKERLAEAVALYIDSLYRMGTLEDILIERGFRKAERESEMWQSFEIPEKMKNTIREWDMVVPVPLLLGTAGKLAVNA